MRTLLDLSDVAARAVARLESPLGQRPILIACSGGIDSTALAHVFGRLRRAGRLANDPILVHCDHGQHEHSAAAAAHVANLAWTYGLRFQLCRLDLPKGASEAVMRKARYDALVATARETGAAAVLTGHHADDDLETVLFRMLRGTGPRGLGGIPRSRWLAPGILVLRPFLEVRRRDLQLALEADQKRWVEDPSNTDSGANARAAIRHVLLPKLRAKHGVKLDADLFVIGRVARATSAILEAEATRLLSERQYSRPHGASVELDLEGLSDVFGAPGGSDILGEALRQIHDRLIGATPKQSWMKRATGLLSAGVGRRLDGGGGVLVERTPRGLMVWAPERLPALPDEAVDLSIDDQPLDFGDSGWRFQVRVHGQVPLDPPVQGDRAILDAAGIGMPLRVRTRRPGDTFLPLGARRPVDLRRFLQKRHVSRFDRERQAVVVDGNDDSRILWVPGVEIADDARVRIVLDPERDSTRTHPTRACLDLRAVGRG